MAESLKFTKPALKALPWPPPGHRLSYADTTVRGLQLRVTSRGIKSFQVYKKLGSKPVRVTLGRFPDMTIEQARRLAKSTIAAIAEGINPNAAKRALRSRVITLGEVFENYLMARKALKPRTIEDYRQTMRTAFADWHDKPLSAITRDMVASKHRKLGKASEARANNAMRVLRAMFNFAAGEYEDENGHSLFPDNPVTRLSHTRAWYRVDRRRTYIKPQQLKPWFEAVLHLPGTSPSNQAEIIRDYLLLLLFTGLRREEAAQLTWDNVDLPGRTLTVTDTKNREPHTLPLSDYLVKILSSARAKATTKYVFPSPTSGSGHIINPGKQISCVRSTSGVEFTLHDLRRTFTTLAESLDISAYAVKRLVNHKMRDDVTAGYIVMDVERLRNPMQAITDLVLKTAGQLISAKIISIDNPEKSALAHMPTRTAAPRRSTFV